MRSQASSLRFLADQGFDFNRWVRDGIGYMTADERDARLAELKPAAGRQVRGLGEKSGRRAGCMRCLLCVVTALNTQDSVMCR